MDALLYSLLLVINSLYSVLIWFWPKGNNYPLFIMAKVRGDSFLLIMSPD